MAEADESKLGQLRSESKEDLRWICVDNGERKWKRRLKASERVGFIVKVRAQRENAVQMGEAREKKKQQRWFGRGVGKARGKGERGKGDRGWIQGCGGIGRGIQVVLGGDEVGKLKKMLFSFKRFLACFTGSWSG